MFPSCFRGFQGHGPGCDPIPGGLLPARAPLCAVPRGFIARGTRRPHRHCLGTGRGHIGTALLKGNTNAATQPRTTNQSRGPRFRSDPTPSSQPRYFFSLFCMSFEIEQCGGGMGCRPSLQVMEFSQRYFGKRISLLPSLPRSPPPRPGGGV